MNTYFPRLEDEFSDREFRDTYVDRRVRRLIAYQLRALREDRGFSQQQVAELLGMKQSAVSRLENPEYGRVSVSTLLKAAAAYDVALIVRFVTHAEFSEQTSDLSPLALVVKSYHASKPRKYSNRSGETLSNYKVADSTVICFPQREQPESIISIDDGRTEGTEISPDIVRTTEAISWHTKEQKYA